MSDTRTAPATVEPSADSAAPTGGSAWASHQEEEGGPKPDGPKPDGGE